ncbi:rab-GTPase-TBC domain-containing protein [Xylariaceae sp. FL0016]|nr:rab-GTPase-TBC domain-containing protein [Xylariaceae sp. FL0016]
MAIKGADSSASKQSENTTIEDRGAGRDASDDALVQKKARILEACERRDLDHLKDLAVSSGGLMDDELRSQAWPILLGFNADMPGVGPTRDGSGTEKPESWQHLPRHQDEDQVKLDVDRSFVYYPHDDTPAELDDKKAALQELIVEVLRRHSYLHYFQGYHDICQVFLLVLPPALRAPALRRLSVLRIRDFMLPNLSPALAQLRLIPSILYAVDPVLTAHLGRIEPYFALADTLTMFAHNVQRYASIARLFDALIAREQVFCLYVFARTILHRRAELLATDEADMLHFTLSKLPQDLDLDAIIRDAAALFAAHPPESLHAWRRGISNASVLKTTRHIEAATRQTLDDGRRFFDRQLRELEWVERRQRILAAAWRNRALMLTIVVGVGAVYLRKTGFWSGVLAWGSRLGRS